MLSGEASRLDPGEATVQLLIRDLDGTKLLAGEQPIGEPRGDGLTFTANVPVAPGGYVLRVAVIDGAGRVGSVDHRVDAGGCRSDDDGRERTRAAARAAPGRGEPRLAVDTVRQDERLAVQIDLDGEQTELQTAEVDFEIARRRTARRWCTRPQSWPRSARARVLAQGVSDMRVLPPGS